MNSLEIYLSVICCFLAIGSFIISLWYRDAMRKIDLKDDLIARQEEMLDLAKEKNALLSKQIHESDKKAKLSGDVLAVLADMKAGGAVLEVTRVDRNDIFFHNGGAYR